MSNPVPASPAGWYVDPYGRHQGRYWSGTEWTDHVDDAGVQSVDPPPPPPDDTVLDLEAVYFQHHEIRFQDQAAELAVHAVEDQRQVAKVSYGSHQATLTDLEDRPILSVGTSFSPRGGGRVPGGVAAIAVRGPFGQELARLSTRQVVTTWTFSFMTAGTEVLGMKFTRGALSGEINPVTLTAGGMVIGGITEHDRRQTGMFVSSWLRLDRAPSLGDPMRSLTTAAPLVLLTTFS